MEPMLEFRDVCFSYRIGRRQKKSVLHDIDLSIRKGETFALIGESGCGKSTLAQVASHLLVPDSGTVLFNGEDMNVLCQRDYKSFRRNVQIVFQDPYSSLDDLKTVRYLIEEPLVIHGNTDQSDRLSMVKEMMAAVGLDLMYLDSRPSRLSGGLRQRLALAVALVLRPSFLILDESVSALDVSVQAQVLNLLSALQKKLNLTYLFISHDLDVVSYMADRIAVMYMGRIVEVGPAVAVVRNPLHFYTRQLLAASGSGFAGLMEDSSGREDGRCPFASACTDHMPSCDNGVPKLRLVGDDHWIACPEVSGT